MALVVGSIFYNTPHDTDSFFQRGGVIFFAVLFNALMALTEINELYSQRSVNSSVQITSTVLIIQYRPIVEKQASYAFYHPFTEALAGVVSNIPVKLLIVTAFDIILYFLAGLRRTAGQFFIFFLFNFIAILTVDSHSGFLNGF
jgi:ATP-binding cassette subfamily G (WHITE) protein 2 (PDR)